MKITFESELMKNHKHAEVMSPDSKFQALQTDEGHSLLFSIGSDGVFYLTREIPGDVTGWQKTDLSSPLSSGKVVAKNFDIERNGTTGNIDLALIVTIDGQDHLFLSLNNAAADATWSQNLTWQDMPYDGPAVASLVLYDVYLAEASDGEYIVVDALKNPSDPLNFINRYYIDPSKQLTGKIWNSHDLSGNLQASQISSLTGRRANELCDGIYTLGSILNERELLYTPLFNAFDPTIAPDPVYFTVPPLASAIAVAPNGDGTTNLYVTGDKALYFFPSNQQTPNSAGQAIVNNAIFAGVQNLYADVTDTEVFVWGLNQAGAIFYLQCSRGQETNSAAWSFPVPILQGLEQIAPYANRQYNHSVIFAHLQGDNLIQLTQDANSASWQQRNILLPSTDPYDVVQYQSYSTHVQVLGDDNLPLKNPVTLSITSTSPVGIYVNNIYHKLSPDVPTDIDTEVTGALTIIQETQSLSAMCYHVLQKDSGVTLAINPMTKLIDTVSTVQSGDDLGNIQVKDEQGNSKPLIPADTPTDQKTATASAMQQFVTVSKTLPADGSKTAATAPAKMLNYSRFVPSSTTIWGISFAGEGWSYHEGEEAMARFGLQKHESGNTLLLTNPKLSIGDIGDAIEVAAEDVWNWFKSVVEAVEQFFVQLVEDVYHIFVQIGEALYHFVIDCIHVICQAVEFIFNKIKTFFEDLIKWLGFIFQWQDMLRTHNVIKNLFKQYAAYAIANIGNCKTQLQGVFENLENDINAWAGLPPVTDTVSGLCSAAPPAPGQHSPQSNWGVYHTHTNATNASSSYTPPPANFSNTVIAVLNDLLALVGKEIDTFNTAIDNFKTLADNFTTMSLTDILKQITGILGDIILETLENITLTVIDIFQDLLEGFLGMLDAPLDIPVISWLYNLITGSQLSFLDLVCLVVAIPTTIIYKLATDQTPFPDDSTTNALIGATDFNQIVALCNGTTLGAIDGSGLQIVHPDTLFHRFQYASNIMAITGSVVLSILLPLKILSPESPLLATLSSFFYFPYASPDIIGAFEFIAEDSWVAIMNEVIAQICLLKTCIDIRLVDDPNSETLWAKASPWLDFVFNFLWNAPAIGGFLLSPRKTDDKVSLAGNLMFNIGGMLSLGVALTKGIPQGVFVTLCILLNLGYGGCSIALNYEANT